MTQAGQVEHDLVGEKIRAAEDEFARNLDVWLSYARIGIAGAVTPLFWFFGPPGFGEPLAVTAYLGCAIAVPIAFARASEESAKSTLRAAMLLLDGIITSYFAYRWGIRSSPAALLFVPVVVGWTLLPQWRMRRLAVLLVLLASGLLVLEDYFGWLGPRPTAPFLGPGPGGAVLLFVIIASTFLSAYQLLEHVVVQLRAHVVSTARLRAKQETQERDLAWAARLEEAQRLEALGRLAGGVAHDFSNLLTVLIGCAEIASARLTRDPDAARSALSDLKNAAERGAGLSAQLLDFARKRSAHAEDLDLTRVLERVLGLLGRTLRGDLHIRMDLGTAPCPVHLDPGGLERMMLNLALNASDAMPHGGELRVTLTVEREPGGDQTGPCGVLRIADTGSGIDGADIPHIFEPFFTRKERGKGSGLGLASVYGFVQQSGGAIAVTSTRGKGTCFTVRFPLLSRKLATPGFALPAMSGNAAPILLVDDNDGVRRVLTDHLQTAGCDVISVGSASEALQVLERGNPIALLVSDVSMPYVSGVELAERARFRQPGLPILLVSGYADELEGESAQRVAGVHFLAKPFSGRRLHEEIKRILA
jgi:signal transduction histidine kinase/CheY-like chemotaxis protein